MIRERARDGLNVTEPPIEGWQLGAQVDDLELHLAAAGVAAMCFSRVDQLPSQSLPLTRRVDREHAEVAGLAVDDDVDGANERAASASSSSSRNSPFPIREQDIGFVRAVADLEEVLDAVGE